MVIVGVSLGGWIAAEMTVKSTERISSLVFDNAAHFPHIDEPERFDRAAIEFLSRRGVK